MLHKKSNKVSDRLTIIEAISKDFIDSLDFLDDINVTAGKDALIPAPFGRQNFSGKKWVGTHSFSNDFK